jgi:hypothetical protein
MPIRHTPTPWSRNIPPASKYPVIFAGRNTHVTTVNTHGLSKDEIEANTAFIVRACNSHDELVAALKKIKQLATLAERTRGIFVRETIQELHEVSRAALAKVEAV